MFDTIPDGILVPGYYAEFSNRLAVTGVVNLPRRILLVGQRLSAGTVEEGVLTRIYDGPTADGLFGRGSPLAEMARAAKKANRFTEMWAIALDEASAGAKAAGNVSFSGTATQAGTLRFRIGGKAVSVGVSVGDTATEVATAFIAAVQAKTDLAVAAAVNGTHDYQADLTCKWKGASGNYVDVRLNYFQGEATPAGIVPTITALSAGATNPDAADAIAAMGPGWFTHIAVQWSDSSTTSAMESELLDRSGPTVQKGGRAFYGVSGTLSAMNTLVSARNSRFSVMLCTGKSPTPPWIDAAIACAVRALEPDPARPSQTLLLTGMDAPAETDRLTFEERNLLLAAGGATFYVDDAGLCRIERLVTTYKTNELSVPDPSYRDVETGETLDAIRFSIGARLKQVYPRHKLADDGTNYGPGQPIVTPSLFKAEILHAYKQMEQLGWVQDYEGFAEELDPVRDETDRSAINAVMGPRLVSGFRISNVQFQFRL